MIVYNFSISSGDSPVALWMAVMSTPNDFKLLVISNLSSIFAIFPTSFQPIQCNIEPHEMTVLYAYDTLLLWHEKEEPIQTKDEEKEKYTSCGYSLWELYL